MSELSEIGMATQQVFHRYEGVKLFLLFGLDCTCDCLGGHLSVPCVLFLCKRRLCHVAPSPFSDQTLNGVGHGLYLCPPYCWN